MKKRLLFLFALSLSAMVGVACAGIADKSDPLGAGSRQALLIANAGYADDDVPLRHPITDASALTDELRRAGFEVVVGKNLTKQAMQAAVADFTTRIKPGSAALIFFSGHGIQLGGQNYLVPINGQIWSEEDVRRDGTPLESVVADMDRAGALVKLVIVDASRENPFERRFRSHSPGLASIAAPEGTLIAYSAAPDTVANDGQGENSLFVAELLKEVRSPGSTAEQVFMAAALGVSRASDGKQVPWISSSLAESFYFMERSFTAKRLPEGTETIATLKPESQRAAEPPLSDRPINERAVGDPPASDRLGKFVLSSPQPAENVSLQQSEPEIPRVLVLASRGTRGEPVPLGVTLQGRADDAVVTIAGLVPGMTLSTGYPLGADTWQVPAIDLAKAWIGPPGDFVGVVNLVAEVHLAETIVHRQPIQLEWVATTPAAPAATPPIERGQPAVPPRQPIPAQRQLDREEIAILVKGGRDLIASGDLAAARVMLQRAAEARDAEAALALAATYDPVILQQLKVYGFAANVAMARTWYEKAKEFGSAVASQRLERLGKGTQPHGPLPSVEQATPKVIVQHDPQASLVERLRNEEAAQKAAANGETPAPPATVTQSEHVTLPAAHAQAEPVQVPAPAAVTTATPTEDTAARLAARKIKAERVRKQRLARERAQAEQAASRRQDQLYYGYAPQPTFGPFGGWGQPQRW